MLKLPLPPRRYTARCWITAILACGPTLAMAQAPYQPGEVIEYKVRGTYPERWQPGRFLRELPGGSQYLIREVPSQFFPEGSESAYAPADLRRPRDGAKPSGPVADAARQPAPTPKGPAAAPPGKAIATQGKGLLGKEELIAYARQVMGDHPFADSRHREAALNQIRDTIKARGTDFQYSSGDDFSNRMNAQGTLSSHIGFAVNSNHGPHPRLDDYFGTFHLRAASRGSKSAKTDGSRVIVTTTDSQHESGALTINRDGTYVWVYLRGDPPAKWKRGKWREAGAEELLEWEAGPALWLLDAKQGGDYMVRMSREPGWPGWIDVGAGKGRTPVEYGRRP